MDKDLLAQYQDNVTEWVIRSLSLFWWPGLPVEQHYQVAMSAHCHQPGAHPIMTLNVTMT